ncbi:hypothetical protein ACFQY0_08290 [Haloferula chungangensis]|uniref:Uncharacterized protein n=1 Tax=Haloferula chungangensis TaxID=1048331 RepID=A0ABW2L7D5_9BACT
MFPLQGPAEEAWWRGMPETIEAEVIEIDGVVPPKGPQNGTERSAGPHSAWSREGMRGRVINLDRRWWPLWVVLGIVAVVLAATVGLLLGVCYLVFSVIRMILRGLFGGLSDGGAGSGALRKGG